MSKSENTKLTVEEIVSEIVSTTEDTYDVFLQLTEDRSQDILNRVLHKLNQPFSFLEDKYIRPLIVVENSLEFQYSEDDYKIADLKVVKSDHVLRHDEVEHRAFEIWLQRKQKERDNILVRYASKNKTDLISTFPTFKTSSKVTTDQLHKVFDKLIELELIDKCDSQTFVLCFTEKTLKEQPHIKFKHSPQILYHLFKLFDKYRVVIDTEKSIIFSQNQLFVDKNGSPFKTPLRTGLDVLKQYPKDKKLKQLVQNLESSFEDIF